MRARVTKTFPGVPDGAVLTRQITAGEIIRGDLAAVAVAAGFADPVDAEEGGAAVSAKGAADLADAEPEAAKPARRKRGKKR